MTVSSSRRRTWAGFRPLRRPDRSTVRAAHVILRPPGMASEIADLVGQRIVARASKRWPDLPVDTDGFVRHVTGHWPEWRDEVEGEALHMADLYLAYACLEGDSRALAEFDRQYLSSLETFVARITRDREIVDEVRQRLSERLLVPAAPGERPKLADYTGRGALAAWVAVAAQRTALSLLRKREPEVPTDLTEVLADLGDPNLDAIKDRYRRQVEEAFRAAVQDLPPRDRLILRMHAVKGLSMEAIGAMYRVNQSTVSRWIAKSRETLVERLRHHLVDRYGIQESEVTSLVRLVQSQVDISLAASQWSAVEVQTK